jgi:hypothetical protein
VSHAVVAQVPATAVDKDTGQPVGVAFTLRAPVTDSATAAPSSSARSPRSWSSSRSAAAYLSTLAARVASSTASATVEVARQVSAAVLAERNLSAATIAQQAQVAAALTAPPASDSAGPFVSVRRFTYTDADNRFVLAFPGDSSPPTDDEFVASESRIHQVDAQAVAFNRNTAWANQARRAWELCPVGFRIVRTQPQTATRPQDSTVCGGSRSLRRVAAVDAAGRRGADAAAPVGNANTLFLDDLPYDQADPALRDIKRYRAALSGDSLRYYACDVVDATNALRGCATLGEGRSAAETRGDSRVLRFATGYPVALTAGVKRQRQLVCASYAHERHNAVTVTPDGRRLSEVVNSIRAHGSREARSTTPTGATTRASTLSSPVPHSRPARRWSTAAPCARARRWGCTSAPTTRCACRRSAPASRSPPGRSPPTSRTRRQVPR